MFFDRKTFLIKTQKQKYERFRNTDGIIAIIQIDR